MYTLLYMKVEWRKKKCVNVYLRKNLLNLMRLTSQYLSTTHIFRTVTIWNEHSS